MKKTGFILILIWAASAAVFSEKESLVLKPEAEVETVFIRLSDLIRGRKTTRIDASAIFLGKSPKWPRIRKLRKEYIEKRIQQAGVSLKTVEVTGPEILAVSRTRPPEPKARIRTGLSGALKKKARKTAITERELIDCVTKFFKEKYKGDNYRITVKIVSYRSSFLIPPDVDYMIKTLKVPGITSTGHVTISLGIFADNKMLASDTCRFYVKVMHKVIATRRSVKKGSVLESEDLHGVWIRGRPGIRQYIYNVKKAVGKILLKNTPKNEPIRIKDIQSIPAVRRGEVVEAVYSRKGLVIKSTVKALEDGCSGEIIRAINTRSGKMISGTVTETGSIDI